MTPNKFLYRWWTVVVFLSVFAMFAYVMFTKDEYQRTHAILAVILFIILRELSILKAKIDGLASKMRSTKDGHEGNL